MGLDKSGKPGDIANTERERGLEPQELVEVGTFSRGGLLANELVPRDDAS